MFSEEMFKNRILTDNLWWETGAIGLEYSSVVPRVELGKFFKLLTAGDLHRAILLIGPRRVGKTWLIQHAIGKLIAENTVDARHIVYVPVDVPVYHGCALEELLKAVAKNQGVDLSAECLYVFFDEIQYKKNWENELKTLTDTYRKIRFVASGSAASVLSRGAKESGAGRFTDITLGPISFYEYVRMTGMDEGIFESMETANKTFLEYMNFGGYPELVTSKTVRDNAHQFIQRDIVDKVLLRDLPSLYNIGDVRDLQSFFSYVAFHSGMIQSMDVLSRDSGLTKHMIANLIKYLEESFLVIRHDRVDANAMSMRRTTQFKLYLTNPSLRAAMFRPIAFADSVYFGHVVETAMSVQLGIGTDRQSWRYANWKVGRNEGEVDFVRIDEGTQRPDFAFEVKWSDGPYDHPDEIASAVMFAKQNGLDSLTVTTRTQSGEKNLDGVTLKFIPTVRYAYELGCAASK